MNIQEIQSLIAEALNSLTWLEGLAVIFGLAYVSLAAMENIWCWPAALLSVSLYIYICLEAQLYAETGLQIFYWIMAIVGWLSWKQAKSKQRSAENSLNPKQKQPLSIITWPLKTHILVIGLNTAGTFLLAWILGSFTDAAYPLLDSFTTVFSLFATWMVARKVLENWLYWIIIDTASVFLYAGRDLYLTSLLFILYAIIAAVGYWKWHRQYKVQLAE